MRSFFAGVLCATALVTSAVAQTLTIGVRGGPDSIDPHFTATGSHAEALKHVFDTLVWSGDGLELEPRLAESWRVINDNTWEFKLRRGVKFHDGSDFTAQDVKFSIERIPVVSGPNPTTIYVRRVKETRIIDPLTIHVVTDGPAPTLPNDFIRLFIVSSKAAAGLTKENANEALIPARRQSEPALTNMCRGSPRATWCWRATMPSGAPRSPGHAMCARRLPMMLPVWRNSRPASST